MSNVLVFAAGATAGSLSEAAVRDFLGGARQVRAETLVWTDGMAAGRDKAGEIPGLFRRRDAPPAMPQAGAAETPSDGRVGGQLSIDIDLWPFLGAASSSSSEFAGDTGALGRGQLLSLDASRMIVPVPAEFRLHRPGAATWYVFIILALAAIAGRHIVPRSRCS